MTPSKLDFKKIVESFLKNLECEINNQTDSHHLAFMLEHYAKGDMTDEDCIEMRGYFKGLKVAREMMQKVIAYAEYETGVMDE